MVTQSRRKREQRIGEGLRRAGLRDHLDEDADSGVPSNSDIRAFDKVDGPTPMTAPGAKTIRTEEMQHLLSDIRPLILTTTPNNPSIPGAIRVDIPYGGSLSDEWQANLRRMVKALMGEGLNRPIVVFGHTINHWQARNVVLRLVALGYPNVYWYRGGWEAWDAHDLPKAPLTLVAK
jgi:adenylate cyclase